MPNPNRDGNADKENHRGAVHGEEAIESLRGNDVVVRQGQLYADHHRLKTPDQKKKQRVRDVHQPDLLMIDRGDP